MSDRRLEGLVVAVDFDGTIVEHAYPGIGDPVPGAISKMKMMIGEGAKLILLTMRSDDYLKQAVDYCKAHGIEFWGVNNNPTQKQWTNSRKVYAQVYIDDAAYGCPLIAPHGKRPYVDWSKIRI